MFQVPGFSVLSFCFVCLCLQYAFTDAIQQNDCFEGQFKCDNGQCISANRKCDSFKDCSDGSDETFVQCYDKKCSGTHLQCSYGGCFDSYKMCDGKKDCWDGTDEYKFDCVEDMDLYEIEVRGYCRNTPYVEFQCMDNECLPFSQLCDGVENCQDGSDESSEFCMGSMRLPETFRCAYGASIALSAACNNVTDCRDGSDELDAICNKRNNLTITDDWKSEPKQNKPDAPKPGHQTPKPTSTRPLIPQTAERNCNVTGTGLRLRTMYNGLPYLGGGTVPHQTTVRLSCSYKYHLVGSDVNTCDNGEWKAPWSECIKTCGPGAIINDPSIRADCSYENNIIDCATDPLVVGSIATVKCAQGYNPRGNITQGERICDSSGNWTRSKQQPKRLRCIPDCGKTFDTVKGFPWMISVFQRMASNKYIFRCLGAIIDPFYVVTVSSCFSSIDPLQTVIVIGNQSVGFYPTKEHGYETRTIANIEVNKVKPLALLKMINPFILSAKERPICLRKTKNETVLFKKEDALGQGQPIELFQKDKQKYFLKYIADNNSLINMNEFHDKIKDVLKQN